MPPEEHIAATGELCDTRDPDGNCPHDADFWWNNHIHAAARHNLKPFARNPFDIGTALRAEDGHHRIWLDCWESAITMEEHGVQSVVQSFADKYVARLLDAGILTRPNDI